MGVDLVSRSQLGSTSIVRILAVLFSVASWLSPSKAAWQVVFILDSGILNSATHSSTYRWYLPEVVYSLDGADGTICRWYLPEWSTRSMKPMAQSRRVGQSFLRVPFFNGKPS